jgi:transcriptional regulator with XRE-family HTH domain
MCYYKDMSTVRELRERDCRTQLEVMEAIGMRGRSNFTRIEHRKQKPRISTRRKIAEYFKVEPRDVEW